MWKSSINFILSESSALRIRVLQLSSSQHLWFHFGVILPVIGGLIVIGRVGKKEIKSIWFSVQLFLGKRNNDGQEGTCEGKSDVRTLWDFPGCNVDLSMDTTARCRGLDVTFSHNTVTPLYSYSKFYSFRLCWAYKQIEVHFLHAVDTVL